MQPRIAKYLIASWIMIMLSVLGVHLLLTKVFGVSNSGAMFLVVPTGFVMLLAGISGSIQMVRRNRDQPTEHHRLNRKTVISMIGLSVLGIFTAGLCVSSVMLVGAGQVGLALAIMFLATVCSIGIIVLTRSFHASIGGTE